MIFGLKRKTAMPDARNALPGRQNAIRTSATHYVSGVSLHPPYPKEAQLAMFGAGCFWGVERKYWNCDGVHVTAAGYSAGMTPNPTYREVCTGMTGHNEVVLVVFDPDLVPYQKLLRIFWECHDPTQGLRQGNDVGTQYRSGIYTYGAAQHDQARQSLRDYRASLRQNGYGNVTTEIAEATEFYFAEPEHQQYLAKNPWGYCGLGGTGVCYESSARSGGTSKTQTFG